MASKKIRPNMVFADKDGQIYDHPDLLMLCRRGMELAPPRPAELIPLPDESEFFLLPDRMALGLNPESGQVEAMRETAVAVFVSPGHTATGLAAYMPDPASTPPLLPLFSYAAVGYAQGKFWAAAKKVDQDTRQVFKDIPTARIQKGAREWLTRFPDNRLVSHLMGCACTYACPAAKNLCLGRYEAPLPTARTCNARCVGCLSLQAPDSGFCSTQQRISFTPTVKEIVEIMLHHASHEKRPIFSFGQGCEGEPLTEAGLIAASIAEYRAQGGPGSVNINTNASLPETIADLARAGLDSIRVSLNSAREELYHPYYRPKSYALADVRKTMAEARKAGLFISLNLLYFPGVTDSEEETAALCDLVVEHKVDLIQLRNLNLDPELYLSLLAPETLGPSAGLVNFMKRLSKARPELRFGYFNPHVR